MGIGRRTADRYWAYARAWLCDALSDNEPTSGAVSPESADRVGAGSFRRLAPLEWTRNRETELRPTNQDEPCSDRRRLVPARGLVKKNGLAGAPGPKTEH